MTVYGRRLVPGERQDVFEHSNYDGVLNRTIRAQVSSVLNADGYVTLDYDGLPSGGKFATVAPLWMSFPDSSIGGPAWGRYMPQRSDLVKLAFDYDDKPHIVGFDIVAGKPGVANGIAGWPQLKDQNVAAGSNDDKSKFAQFSALNPGEYDFMSSGGAYIYGNNKGRLYMAGGTVSVSLIKNDLRMSSSAQLWSHLADDCDFRLGQVRRMNPTSGLDEKVTTDTNGTFKEFNVSLKTTTAPGTALGLAELKIGNVIDSTGMAQQTPKAMQDARFWYQAFDAMGQSKLKMAIDTMGNWDVVSTGTDKGINFDFTSSDIIMSSKNATFNMSTKFDVKCANILLGDNASDPLILSSKYRPAEDTLLQSIVTQISKISTALNIVGGLLTTAGGSLAPPIGGSTAAAPSVTSAGVALTSTVASIAGQIASDFATFKGQAQTFLSNNTKTK